VAKWWSGPWVQQDVEVEPVIDWLTEYILKEAGEVEPVDPDWLQPHPD
jgi:hypothetical protein